MLQGGAQGDWGSQLVTPDLAPGQLPTWAGRAFVNETRLGTRPQQLGVETLEPGEACLAEGQGNPAGRAVGQALPLVHLTEGWT